MKLAVIADIHSNYLALEAALAVLERISPDGLILLGDYVSDCPYPQRTMKLLYECRERYPCWFVRGNREDYLLRHRENPQDGWRDGSSTGSLLYTYENLTDADLDFFASMPVSCHIRIHGCPILAACHASPADTREWLKDRPDLLAQYTDETDADLLLCGHTHIAQVTGQNGKTVIFCPSVGLVQDRGSDARLTVLTSDGGPWQHAFLPVDFDMNRLILDFEESGLNKKANYWAKAIIKSMVERLDIACDCVNLAAKKAREEGFTGSVIPEAYWEAAARELGIE